MKGIMVVSESCQPCASLKLELKELIDSGEIELVSLEKEPDRAADLMNKYEIGLPGLVIVSNTGEVVAKVV